ncbi:MAG TPA: hypothetical protein VH593_28950 [Ktedonobacteraceae bacterium]|jgi:hypothetical protein
MNITPDEAQSALDTIKQAKTQAHAMVNVYAYYWLLWGAVWTTGFLLTQFEPKLLNWIWSMVLIIGIAGSTIIGIRQGGSMRSAPGSQAAFLGARYGIFNGVLYCFVILWWIIFSPTPSQIGMLWITAWSFSAIIAGVWFNIPLSIGIGVGVTLMSVIGYYALPHYFWLWAAVFAGLPLIGMGAYYLRQK